MRGIRVLRTKTLEGYLLKTSWASNKTVGFTLIYDCRRPSTLNDFPYLTGIEDRETFGRANYIKVWHMISPSIDNSAVLSELEVMVSCLLEPLEGCHWNMEKQVVTDCHLNRMSQSRAIMFEFFEALLKSEGCEEVFKKVTDDSYKYLSQD